MRLSTRSGWTWTRSDQSRFWRCCDTTTSKAVRSHAHVLVAYALSNLTNAKCALLGTTSGAMTAAECLANSPSLAQQFGELNLSALEASSIRIEIHIAPKIHPKVIKRAVKLGWASDTTPGDLAGGHEFEIDYTPQAPMHARTAEGRSRAMTVVNLGTQNDDISNVSCCSNPGCTGGSQRVAAMSKCARCKLAMYCSRECQVADWKRHKKQCQPC